MSLGIGIIGLPNVGKSTLFNALLKKQTAFVANYPFATIEPNVGIVPVPDPRLQALPEIVAKENKKLSNEVIKETSNPLIANYKLLNYPPIKPATVNFVDIAGLVKGASEGAGLGNKFLSHIREVSIIAHVVRAFEDPSASSGQAPIIREGSVDPKTDYETIKTELILADLQTIQNAQSRVKRFAKESEKTAIEKLFKGLNEGKRASEIELSDEEKEYAKTFFLLSDKPEIIVLNVSEEQIGQPSTVHSLQQEWEAVVRGQKTVVISAKIESELSELSDEEQKAYLKDLGVEKSGLERLIQKAYATLGLISFLTCGEKEVRAWTINRGMKAVDAAGVIHTDFTKKFIKAEVVSFRDFIDPDSCGVKDGPARNDSASSSCVSGGWKGARENGKTRMEGRDYIMQDGDVVEFKIGS